MRFDPATLQAAARGLCNGGMEMTPAELEARCRDMIADYRTGAAEAGRHDVALGWTDERVWERVQVLVAWDGPEGGAELPPAKDTSGLN